MSPQAGFVLVNEVVPRLRSMIPHTVHFVGSEDAEELIQDATAFAARLLHNAELAGKQVTPGSIAYYTLQHIRSGRRSTGSSVVDVLQSGTQLHGRVQIVSIEELMPFEEYDNETFTLADVLSHDIEDPAVKATRNLDWKAFCESQPRRNQAILKCAAQGEPLTELAKAHQVSYSSIRENRNRLAQEIKEFMGEDILKEATKPPSWKHNLLANRERMAWKKAK